MQQHTINTDYQVGPVHCYSGNISGELVLFDTGPPTGEAQACLREELDLSRLKHVVITHYHVDHCGLVSWLEKETDADLYLPYRDTLKIEGYEERLRKLSGLLQQAGFDQSFVDSFRQVMNVDEVFPQFPESFLTVETELSPKDLRQMFICHKQL